MSTHTERYHRAMSLFERLCDEPASRWPALLHQLCDDSRVRSVVGGMLSIDARSSAELRLGSPAPSAPPWRPDVHLQAPLGAFTLLRPLGIGGMGEVWQGVHRATHTPVAIKFLLAETSQESAWIESFRAEVRAVAAMSSPHIIQVFDEGAVPTETVSAAADAGVVLRSGSPYLVMEHASGGSLRPWLRTPVAWARLRAILVALLQALAHAHARGILHRDIKPANVLWCDSADARPGLKLADFGLSHDLGQGKEAYTAGTIGFMAPEQFAGAWRDFGPWTDLYSVGVMTYALLHGALPADADAAWAPRMPVPPGVEAWTRRLMAGRPGQRFPDAATALAGLLGGGTWRAERSAPRPMPLLLDIGLGLTGLREPPLLGREAEQARLRALLDSDGPRVAIVRGVSGVGKSRLARWLCVSAQEQGRSQSATITAGMPSPLVGLLERLSGCAGLDPTETDARLASQGVNPKQRSVLSAILSHRTDVPASARRRALLAYLCRSGPFVLHLEDAAQDPAMMGLAQAALGSALPIVVVLTTRSEDVPHNTAKPLAALCARADVEVIDLKPLPAAHWGALVDGVVPLFPPLRDTVVALTAGNPRLVQGLIASWAEQGLLVADPEGFRLRAGAPRPHLDPDRLWIERVERLMAPMSPDERIALELAAALGSQVDLGEWQAVCAHANTTASVTSLSHGFQGNLLDGLPGGFAFSHAAVRAAIRQQAAARWAAHNRACATVLAQIPQMDERVGRHLLAADAPAEALPWLFNGASLRRKNGDFLGSSAVFSLWDSVAQQIPDQADPSLWARARINRASNATICGDNVTAAEIIETVRPMAAGVPDLMGELLLHESYIVQDLQDWDAGTAVVKAAVDLIPQISNASLQARIKKLYAGRLSTLGRLDEAMALLTEAAEALRESGHPHLHADALRRLAFAQLCSLQLQEAQQNIEAVIAYFQTIHASFHLRNLHILQAGIAIERGDLEAATQANARALAYANEVGRDLWVSPTIITALIDALYGRFQESHDKLSLLIQQFEHRKNVIQDDLYILRLPACLVLGDADGEAEAMRRVRAARRHRPEWVTALKAASEQAILRDRRADAADILTIAAETARGLGRTAQSAELHAHAANLRGDLILEGEQPRTDR